MVQVAVAEKPSAKAKAPKISAASSRPAPTTAKMVVEAISSLKEKKGSSVLAIKKYIAGNFIVDADRILPFIKRYIKSAVADKTIIQAKGTTLSGSFKLAKSDVKSAKKPTVEKRPKKESVKASKPASEKSSSKKTESSAPAKKQAAAKKPSIPKSPKPSKEKKAGVKSPVAAKPRIPKPKKPSAPVSKKTKK